MAARLKIGQKVVSVKTGIEYMLCSLYTGSFCGREVEMAMVKRLKIDGSGYERRPIPIKLSELSARVSDGKLKAQVCLARSIARMQKKADKISAALLKARLEAGRFRDQKEWSAKLKMAKARAAEQVKAALARSTR